jgi:hypothetical protein
MTIRDSYGAKKKTRATYGRTPASRPRCEEQPAFRSLSPAVSLWKCPSLRFSELRELARMLNELRLHREAHAGRDWVGQAWHVHRHQAYADALRGNAFERIIFNKGGCLARRLCRTK